MEKSQHLQEQSSKIQSSIQDVVKELMDGSNGINQEESKILQLAVRAENLKKRTTEHLTALFNSRDLVNEINKSSNEAHKAELSDWRYRDIKGLEIAKDPDFDALKAKFPNFENAIDFFESQCSLNSLSDSFFKSRPVLFVGDPGLGKTKFCKELANMMGLEFYVINCGTLTAGWVLSGNNPTWQSAKPGEIARALKNSDTANPVIMLDEIDKLKSAHQNEDPFASLYGLLEKDTAKAFKDEFLGFNIDVSNVSFVATANDLNKIPEPILSRFKIVEVRCPNIAEMTVIAKNIYKDIIKENPWGNAFGEITEEVAKEFAEVCKTPRTTYNYMLEAFGLAARKYGKTCEKIPVEKEHVKNVVKKQERKIGF